MAVVNTNISASLAQASSHRMSAPSARQWSSCLLEGRKNTAADDAAGLAISTRMSSQIIGLGAVCPKCV